MLLSEVVTAEYAKHVETLYPPPPNSVNPSAAAFSALLHFEKRNIDF